MAMMAVYTSTAEAAKIACNEDVVVSCNWNATKTQEARERAILLPQETIDSIASVPHQFRSIVQAAFVSTASANLKTILAENMRLLEIDSEQFSPETLTDSFVNGNSVWMDKSELEMAFSKSATWQKFVNKPEFESNAGYRNICNAFKDDILKLSGKAAQIPKNHCEIFLTKLDEKDLETPFGRFITYRLNSLLNKKEKEIDWNSL